MSNEESSAAWLGALKAVKILLQHRPTASIKAVFNQFAVSEGISIALKDMGIIKEDGKNKYWVGIEPDADMVDMLKSYHIKKSTHKRMHNAAVETNVESRLAAIEAKMDALIKAWA